MLRAVDPAAVRLAAVPVPDGRFLRHDSSPLHRASADNVREYRARVFYKDLKKKGIGAAVQYIDPHIHMISRTTDDYQRMAYAGCAAVSEPAFWAGYDRGTAAGFHDYFRHLTEVEPKRAAQFHIRHYSWLCINAKEAENVQLSREVIAAIPEFLTHPNVLG